MTAGASTAPAPFEAFLYPNPALSDRGFAVFMGIAGFATLCLGGFFVAVGAWPIGGFFGLDFLLLYLAFRAARRNARRYEWVRVEPRELVVRRVGPDGRAAEWRFEPFWVRVHFDEPPRPDSPVVISSHGRRLGLGLFLTPDERREFAATLRAALERARQPRF